MLDFDLLLHVYKKAQKVINDKNGFIIPLHIQVKPDSRELMVFNPSMCVRPSVCLFKNSFPDFFPFIYQLILVHIWHK